MLLWQEGIGRYVEWKAAQVAAMEFEPSLEFAALPDAVGWDEAARTQERRAVRGLESGSLADDRRVFFYPIGAAFGALLDRQAPGWKERYRSEKFALHRYLDSGTEAPD